MAIALWQTAEGGFCQGSDAHPPEDGRQAVRGSRDIFRQIRLLLGHMNDLYDPVDLLEEMSRRITEAVTQLLESALG
jgi:hypothetical protein